MVVWVFLLILEMWAVWLTGDGAVRLLRTINLEKSFPRPAPMIKYSYQECVGTYSKKMSCVIDQQQA